MNRPQFEILVMIKTDLTENAELIKSLNLTREQYLNDFFASNEELQGIDKDLYYPFVGELFNEYIY